MFEFLNELNASQLIELRDYLNNMRFLDVQRYYFAYVYSKDIYERYANVTLDGYKKDTIIKCSESLLVDKETGCDIFTGESLEGKWGFHDDDGFIGGWKDLHYYTQGRLLEAVKKYGISCQPFYCSTELTELLKVYDECRKKFSWIIEFKGKEITLPYREYQVVDGKVKALKPLQYTTIYDDKKRD